MPSRLSWRHFFYPSMPCTASALPLGFPVYPPPERLKRASSIRITLSRSSSGQREAITPLRTPWVMPPQRPQTKTSAKGRRLFLLFDREPLKRSQPCLPWLLANLPAIETGRPLMIDRDNVPWNALKYLPDTLSNAPFPDDRVSVSSCLVSLILVWWKENNGCFLRSHELSIALKEEKINAQNSRQCHICELRPRKVLSG